jgi:transcriptional regulator GlxA family with amidase domain
MSILASDKVAEEKLVFVILPRFNMASLTMLIEPLRIANYISHQPLYDWQFLTPGGGKVMASNGMVVECDDLSAISRPSQIVLFGSWGAERNTDHHLMNWLRQFARHGTPLIGVETGAYILARAGLLHHKLATTHWSLYAGFSETFPDIEASEQLYTIDQKIMTCAGGTATADLMLYLMQEQHSIDLAREVSSQMLHQNIRTPETMQRPIVATSSGNINPIILDITRFLERHIEDHISIPELCERTGVPQRKLERLFRRDLGCTVVQFYRQLKLQYARTLLVSTNMNIREISVACGFNSMSYFSYCFSKTFGRKPSLYRMAWPDDQPEPTWHGTIYSFIRNPAKDATG